MSYVLVFLKLRRTEKDKTSEEVEEKKECERGGGEDEEKAEKEKNEKPGSKKVLSRPVTPRPKKPVKSAKSEESPSIEKYLTRTRKQEGESDKIKLAQQEVSIGQQQSTYGI